MTDTELACTLLGCGEPLDIEWTAFRGLRVDDPSTQDITYTTQMDTASWQVTCRAGHVLLLPDPSGCPCDAEDQEGDDCPHNPDDYEWSDEGPHAFRPYDRERLAVVLRRLKATG